MTKPKILLYGDSPTCASGFGTVMKGICDNIHDKYDIEVFGINEAGIPHKFPFHITPALNRLSDGDYLGRSIFVSYLNEYVVNFDLIFMLQDHTTFACKLNNVSFIERVKQKCVGQNIPLIAYFPVDARPRKQWIEPLAHADRLFTYTSWGKSLCEEVTNGAVSPEIVPHGTDTTAFYPLDDSEKKQARGRFRIKRSLDLDCFIVLFVGQNQRRKMIDWVCICFSEFKKMHPNSHLVLQTKPNTEPNGGWDIDRMMENFGLERDIDYSFPNPDRWLTVKEINELYNSADVLLHPSNEGWGLPVTEAMCAGLVTVIGEHTSLQEIGANGRSILVPAPHDPNFIRVLVDDYNVIRRVPDINFAVNMLYQLATRKDGDIGHPHVYHIDVVIDRAREWASTLTWESIAERFSKVFDEEIEKKKYNPIQV